MEILIVAGVVLLVVALIRLRNRGAEYGPHYHDGTYYHSTHDQSTQASTQGDSARHGGDWGSRDMGHDHHHYHGGHDTDSSSGGGWGGDAAGDGAGGGDGDGGGGE